MADTRYRWLPGNGADELILWVDGMEVGRVRRASLREMTGWYWVTKTAVLPAGARIPGGCLPDAPLETQEAAKANLIACIEELLAEQSEGNGR